MQHYHTFREGNISVDVLAKLGTRTSSDVVILKNPSIELQLFHLEDLMEAPYLRSSSDVMGELLTITMSLEAREYGQSSNCALVIPSYKCHGSSKLLDSQFVSDYKLKIPNLF
jgi:hypothetical protein